MARYIHCPECKKRLSILQKEYGELYECVEGEAIRDMFCDGVHSELFPINIGEKCFAAVLLPDRNHFNYEKQKPSVWADQFIKIKSE